MASKRQPPKKSTRARRLMTPARAYRARRTCYVRFQEQELTGLTMQEKFDQFWRLMQWPKALGWCAVCAGNERDVWDRWSSLRETECD